MKRHQRTQKLTEYVDEMRTKQENTVWRNYVRNTRGLDEFFLKGSANATPVQRIAAWLFGLAFILAGFGFLSITVTMERNKWTMWILAGIVWCLGTWICYNGSRRHRPPTKKG